MNWATLIPIIANYGLPLAENLHQKWSSGKPPTPADFAELRALASQTSTDRLKSQLVAAGVALDDPAAIALLNLTK